MVDNGKQNFTANTMQNILSMSRVPHFKIFKEKKKLFSLIKLTMNVIFNKDLFFRSASIARNSNKIYTFVFYIQSSCRAHNARLAEIETKAQSDYLINMARQLGTSTYLYASNMR
jgi:hypothetical protein